MSAVKVMVDSKIAGKKVVMYSKTHCGFCRKAKEVFKKYLSDSTLDESDYEVIEIDNDDKCADIQKYLHSITGGRSVPRVFIKGKCIGGGDETVKLHSSGQLKAMLA